MKTTILIGTIYILNTLLYVFGDKNLGYYMSGLVSQMFIIHLLQGKMLIPTHQVRKLAWIGLGLYALSMVFIFIFMPVYDIWLHVLMAGCITALSLIEARE